MERAKGYVSCFWFAPQGQWGRIVDRDRYVTVHHAIFVDREISEQLFSECGVLLKNEGRFGTYDITADDPRWPCVEVALSTYRAIVEALRGSPVVDPNLGDRVWTEFADDERNQAPFLEMMPSWL